MANPTKTSATQTPAGDDLESFTFERAAGGVTISQAGGQYKAGESCDKNGNNVPLRGWTMRTEARKSPQFGDHVAMVMRLTAPTVVIDAQGKKRVQKDGEVDITMVKKLEAYQGMFEHENLVSEIEIYPTHKEKLKNGHDLWHFDVKVLQVVPRSQLASADVEALQGLLNGGAEQKALPAGTA